MLLPLLNYTTGPWLPFDSSDTQIELVIDEKIDTNLMASGQQLEMTEVSESSIEP